MEYEVALAFQMTQRRVAGFGAEAPQQGHLREMSQQRLAIAGGTHPRRRPSPV